MALQRPKTRLMINYKQLTDYELFGLLKLDDRRAFTEIYDRYKEPLYVHAFHKLRDKEEVRDILQQLFSVLWMKRNEIILNSNLSGYLYASIRNRIFKIIHVKVWSLVIYLLYSNPFLPLKRLQITW